MAEQQREQRQLHIPENLCTAAEEKFGQQFGNVEQLICFVLRELLRDDALVMDEAEERFVEDRLRKLGYI